MQIFTFLTRTPRELWVPKFYEFCDFSIFRSAYLQELQSEPAKTWQSNRTPTYLENLKIWWRQDIQCGSEGCSNLPPCILFLAGIRVAHLQRHLSANRMKLSRSVSKFTYYPGLSAEPPKIVAVSFQLFFITGGQKWRFVIKICTLSIFGEKF